MSQLSAEVTKLYVNESLEIAKEGKNKSLSKK